MKNKIYFITICAANRNYLQQLLLLSYSLELKGYPNPMVLIPNYSTIEEQLIENKFLTKKVDIGVKKEDIYYEKFVLKYISALPENDSFLYIDPDHILIKDFNIPNLNEDCIWVSSEVRRLSDFLNENELDKTKSIYNTILDNDLCYNTSFILCNISYFNKIIPYWENVYNTLYSIVGHRHLEEIALTIAAKHFNYKIKSIDNAIQGNFYNGNFNSKLFHYGGEYEKAIYIKSVIVNSDLSPELKYQKIIDCLWNC